jgi:hypothetical protein
MHGSPPWKTEETIVGLPRLLRSDSPDLVAVTFPPLSPFHLLTFPPSDLILQIWWLSPFHLCHLSTFRVVVLGLPHQITRRETSGRRPSSTTIIAARTDPKSDAPGLKVPRHFTSISCLGRVPSVSWDGIAQETAAIFDGGSQKARRRRARIDVKSAISRDGFRPYYVLITATGGFLRFV